MSPWQSIVKSAFSSLNLCLKPTASLMKYTTRQVGALNTLEYRLYLENEQGKVVSPFHDVPLYPEGSSGESQDGNIVNMFVEIPRWTCAKMEISKEEPMNPVKQDVKKGALRFVKNIFPFHGYPWNYGAIPQTWECPEHTDPSTGFKGDNDPIDAVEIGSKVLERGAVRKVKVLGTIALIDEGETDWKIVVIDSEDPLASQLNDIEDVKSKCPGLLEATVRWFRDYKIPDGKPANEFAFNGEYKDSKFAMQVIKDTHEMWKGLVSGKIANNKGIALNNTGNVTIPEASAPAPAPLPESVNNQVFV